MATRKSIRKSAGKLRSREDVLRLLQSSLQELRTLLVAVEQGNNLFCRSISTTLRRILIDELPIASRGYKLFIRSYLDENSDFTTSFPLTTLEVTRHGTRIAPILLHQPHFSVVKLQKWKTQKVFYGKEASDFFQLSDNGRFEHDLGREQFVKYSRDEIGAHVDQEISIFSEISLSDYTVMYLKVNDEEAEKNAHANTKPPHKWNYFSATIAVIAIELTNSLSVIEHEGKPLLINSARQPPN